MHSTFSFKDQWHGTPFDIGVPQYLNYSSIRPDTSPGSSKKSSSNCDELKILVEPTLYARRLDQSIGVVSNQVERLAVEPYVLHVSSDPLTLRRLAREERHREKRKLHQENIVAESGPVDDKLPFVETTTPLKRKRKSFKKAKLEHVATASPRQPIIHTEQLSSRTSNQVSVQPINLETPMHQVIQKDLKPTAPTQQIIPTQQLNLPTSMQQIVNAHRVNTQIQTQQVIQTHQLNNLQTPTQQTIQTHLLRNIQTPTQQTIQTHQFRNIQTPTQQQVIQAHQIRNAQTPNQQVIQTPKQQPNSITQQHLVQQQQPQSETILLRLANGQVIQVPRSMLKKVNPAPSSITKGNSNLVTVSETRTLPVPGVPIAVRSTVPTSSSAANSPIKVSSNQALQILAQKYSDKKIVYQTNNPIIVGPKTNGIPLAGHSGSNGQTFRFVKIQSPHAAQTLNGLTPASLPQQLFRMGPTSTTTGQQTFLTQPRAVSTTSPFNVPRIVQHQHHTALMSAPVPVAQPTRPSLQQFVTSNGVPIQQQSGQGPMKICIIHSPRKADGTPHPPGSAAPRILVMNPPTNLQQINFNEVLKAISLQNAATTTVADTAHHEA